jgi:hypothetical protein
MAGRQWGNYDNASNSVLWGVSSTTKKRATASNQTAFYENTTPDAYITGLTLGQFGVDATEMGVYNGPVNQATITYSGSGYQTSPVNSVIAGGGGSGANVQFTNYHGRVNSYTIVTGGSSYETNPTVTIASPVVNIFNGNTGISGGGIVFTNANSHWQVGDRLTFTGNTTSTPVGLANNAYYIQAVNTTVITLSTTQGGTPLVLTGAPYPSSNAGGATIQGDTATAVVVTGGALHKGVTHAGWVVRKVGSGGRAGRVQYETLVAMGTIQSDGSDDTILPDSNT